MRRKTDYGPLPMWFLRNTFTKISCNKRKAKIRCFLYLKLYFPTFNFGEFSTDLNTKESITLK